MFADLHSHPTFRPFNDLRNSGKDTFTNADYTIWKIRNNKEKAIATGERAASFSQANVSRLLKGKVKLVYASLYPVEQGFFLGNHSKGYDKKHVQLLAKNWQGTKFNLFISGILNGTVRAVAKLLLNGGIGRDIGNALFMKFSIQRINFLQGETVDKQTHKKYNYFDELQLEHEFIHKFVDLACPDNDADGKSLGCYRIVKNSAELEKSFNQSGEVALVLTVEGGHTLTLNQANHVVSDFDEIQRRINWMKENGIFFLTFAHHFDNKLCGHARSLPRFSNLIIDQEENINEGFSQMGWQVIRQLLSIDGQNTYQESMGRRVLIDVKHMSGKARKEYYDQIVTPYNQGKIAGDPDMRIRKIPVIASHVGYSGFKTFSDVVTNLINADTSDKASVWKRISIGTDFDGMIDPINSFATSEQFDFFKGFLIEALHSITPSHRARYFIDNNPYSVPQIVEMITYKNMYNFTLQNF
jgi:microsomal dipeptidase-like Zn-dependent dipeptidase